MTTQQKIEQHKAFWRGEGPCLILVPPGRDMDQIWQVQIYDTEGYRRRFYDPQRMWESEMSRARPVLDWPTDGIPTVRPNLGVIFVPSMFGQDYEIREGLMPWCGSPLNPRQIRKARKVDVTQTELMRLAEGFYEIHRRCRDGQVAAYHADNQSAFDIAHLVYGDEILYDITGQAKAPWVDELLDICFDVMVRVVQHLKKLLDEPSREMVHGHGTEQGVYFPTAGLRTSEDTPAMISPAHIDRFVIRHIERCAEKFGRVFVHYCGGYEHFFERLCRCGAVNAIDLGNPEMYNTRRLLEFCAETNTVLYSRLAPQQDEKTNRDWKGYIRRLAGLIKDTGARCILRPLVYPRDRADCAAMRRLWHELTA